MNDLYRSARYTLGSSSEAEDVVQETYLQAWKSFHRFEPGTNCRAWLFKIMFHVIAHHRRRWFRVRLKTDPIEDFLDTLTAEEPVRQHLQDKEVLNALDKLPRQFREVIVLADVEDFAYREIAEMLRIPMGTVMSRLNRGRKLLRTQLSGYAEQLGIETARVAVA
jgi:RNA polymerase sigma-70 factor (ECF subfamily)